MTTVPATVQERIMLPAAASGASGEGQAGISAADVFAMLRRRSVLIIVLSLLFSVLAVGGFVFLWFELPYWQAESLIECVSNIPEEPMSLGTRDRLRQDEHERFVLTQANWIRSPMILGESLKLASVRETEWYRQIEKDHLIELTEDLVAAPVRGTNFLRVAIATRKREDSKFVVNGVVDTWYNAVKEGDSNVWARPLSQAREELDKLEREVTQKRQRLARIAGQLPPGAATQPAMNVTAQQVLSYSQQVTMLELELAQLDQFRSIYYDESVGPTPEDIQIVEMDPQVQALAGRTFVLNQQYEADRERFGTNHTETRQLQAQITAADEELQRLRMQRLLERRGNIREAATSAYLNTQHALFVAQENLQKAEAALQDQDQKIYEYVTLEMEVGQDMEMRKELSEYVRNLQRVKDQRSSTKVEIRQRAIDPLERSFPSIYMLPAGVLLAVLFAVGVALLLEMSNTSVRTTQDIARHVDVPLLGAIPHIDDEELPIEQVETAMRDAPRSMVAEAFRRVRTGLQFSAPAARQRAIVVTSPSPEDGKTTVACNLALAIAQGGRRVLLVDANFRRPAIARVFSTAGGRGLSNILIGDGTLADYAVSSGVPLLDLLGSGPAPPNPAELLGSETFSAFLEDAISRYDQVILDTPPVTLTSDALVAATATDGVIVVVRANENSRGLVRRAVGLLQSVNAHIFGAVLNAAQVARGGYFREQLRTYYDYQMESEAGSGGQPALPTKGRNGNGNGARNQGGAGEA
jgi:capsular exopolysaccharide synthesis family protein